VGRTSYTVVPPAGSASAGAWTTICCRMTKLRVADAGLATPSTTALDRQ
jgi:hypothetical protein